jgi:carboxylesterase type B
MQVAYVFDDVPGLGYRVKPLVSELNKAVAKQVASAWINMINDLNPNGPGLQSEWPIYNASVGGGDGQNLVFKKDGVVVEFDDFRAEALKWFSGHFLTVWGT